MNKNTESLDSLVYEYAKPNSNRSSLYIPNAYTFGIRNRKTVAEKLCLTPSKTNNCSLNDWAPYIPHLKEGVLRREEIKLEYIPRHQFQTPPVMNMNSEQRTYNATAWQLVNKTFNNNWGAQGEQRPFRRNILQWTRELDPKSMLEIGCYRAHYLELLRKDGWEGEYTGIDITPAFIEECKKKFPDEKFQIGDARQLPFADNSFDVVMCTGVLMHLDQPWKALAEAERVAKNKVIISAYGSSDTTFSTDRGDFLNTWFSRRDMEKRIKGKIEKFAEFQRKEFKDGRHFMFQWIVRKA